MVVNADHGNRKPDLDLERDPCVFSKKYRAPFVM
jgi:hypothetical protein